MTCNQRTITVLLDTGSDITVAGANLAKKLKWKIHFYPITSVKTANGADMLIDGISNIPFKIGTQTLDTAVLISFNMSDLILGIDWMQNQSCFLTVPDEKCKSAENGYHFNANRSSLMYAGYT